MKSAKALFALTGWLMALKALSLPAPVEANDRKAPAENNKRK